MKKAPKAYIQGNGEQCLVTSSKGLRAALRREPATQTGIPDTEADRQLGVCGGKGTKNEEECERKEENQDGWGDREVNFSFQVSSMEILRAPASRVT